MLVFKSANWSTSFKILISAFQNQILKMYILHFVLEEFNILLFEFQKT